jgi:hypothetical protein
MSLIAASGLRLFGFQMDKIFWHPYPLFCLLTLMANPFIQAGQK